MASTTPVLGPRDPAAPGQRESPTEGTPDRLRIGVIAAYSLPILGAGLMWNMIGFYFLKYATDVLLLAPGVVGLIFGAARIWDAISDPLAGYWSDRTVTRLGRRRPWMLVSAVPLAGLFCALWLPPAALSGAALVTWLTVATFLFYTALTVFRIPHLALGAELTPAPRERTRLFAAVSAMDVVGGLLGIGVLALFVQGAWPLRTIMTWVVTAVAFATVPLIVWCGVRLREPPDHVGRGARSPYSAFRDVWANPHARILVLVDFVPTLGLICASTTAPYLAEYVMGDPAILVPVLGSFALATLAGLPLCVPLSSRFGKGRVWTVARVLQAFALGGLYFAPALGVEGLVALCVFAGLGEGISGVMMRGLQAEVIDWDERRTGERKEGTYFALWNFAAKSALGLAVFGVGGVLQAASFAPGVAQPESSLLAIRLLMSAIPFVAVLGAVAIFQRFRL